MSLVDYFIQMNLNSLISEYCGYFQIGEFLLLNFYFKCCKH